MPRRSRAPRSRQQRLALGFLGVVTLLAAGVLLLSVARVEVMVTPRVEPISADFEITIIGSGTPSEREALGRLVTVEGIGVADTLSSPSIPVGVAEDKPTRAEGTVTLVNRVSSPQPLVATTRLLAPGDVLFRLKSGLTVPANGKLEGVRVYADQPGAHGNIGPTTFKIPGLSKWLQERVWAESLEPMTGGQGVASAVGAAPRPVVRDADLASVREEAVAAAKADAQRAVESLAKSDEEAVTLDASERVTTRGAIGEVGEQIRAEATATMTVIFIPKGAVAKRARFALEAVAASSGRAFRGLRSDGLRTRLVSQDAAAARVTVAVHAEGDAALKGGSLSFEPRRIAGFTAEEVATYLRSIPGVADVEVRLRPFWVRRVPASVGSVEVEVLGGEVDGD